MRTPSPLLMALVAVCGAAACGERVSERARLSLVETLGGADTAGYARAVEPRPFVFPDDHGPHAGFRTEWWYVTGNLEGGDGRAFGFQLTFFRSALAPEPPATADPTEVGSAWGTRQVYMAHFALTDASGAEFHAAERFDRAALGLAGARARPFRVWLGDWSLAAPEGAAEAGAFPMRLRAHTGSVALDLTLERGKPPVAQGERGLSRKGAEPGNASYYYSLTRMPTRGTVRLDGESVPVSGTAWLDREWSTSALPEGVVGWDWFALQLDDGWDLMIYRLRTAEGGAHPLSEGVLVDPAGASRRLSWGPDVQVEPTGTWRSGDGTAYPSGWRVRVPSRSWDLEVTPVLPDQELRLAFRYWEGAVRVASAGEGVAGRGYVELTGYAGDLPER